MYFVATLLDREDGLPTRQENRPAHIEWLKTVPVRIAGPFLDESGEKMIGSLLVIETETEAEARAILAADPYAKAGLFRSTELRSWRWTIGKPA